MAQIQNENYDPNYGDTSPAAELSVEQQAENLEKLLDLIAESLLLSPLVDSSQVEQNQKTIRGGTIQVGRNSTTDLLVLYQKDIKANEEDLRQTTELDDGEVISDLQSIANQIVDFNTLSVGITEGIDNSVGISLVGGGLPGGGTDITNLIVGDGNPLNISQFVSIGNKRTVVNPNQAEEFLDTNIYELLPTGDTRQSRIVRLFQELNALLPPDPPDFQNPIVRDVGNNWTGSLEYSQDNSISYAQDNPNLSNIDEEEAFLHRLKLGAVPANDTNTNKTIEDIYNTIRPYLLDVLEDQIIPDTTLPQYENQSSGYLQFRNLNQGIIIRNSNQNFINGLNPDDFYSNESVLSTGFTITMWTRFLDKSSQGTLFNFGNPTRTNNPFGFKLETYVINGDDIPVNSSGNFVTGFGSPAGSTWGQMFRDGNELNLSWDNSPPNEGFFSQTNTERFVRLVVRDESNMLRGSHVGMPFMDRRAGLPEFSELSGGYDYYTDGDGSIPYDHSYGLMTNVRIPTDFNEWYFICASYNPNVNIEENSHNNANIYDVHKNNPDFWRNNVMANGDFVSDSNLGAVCKVEIISRSDLLRARGFEV
mgnify:CR=1 FL=1|tara:strand:+ start:1328 stop:3100 length:1773 start_codon:yes stop_codon:yes gene_type:complete